MVIGNKGSWASINNFIEESKEDIVFKKHPAYEIADYFRIKLKASGYTLRNDNWVKTKKAAIQVLEDPQYNHITVSDWKSCIDWVFSADRFAHEFWKLVKVLNFKTVIKMYDDFNTIRLSRRTTTEKKNIDYGRIR